jgi:hypothetical protein
MATTTRVFSGLLSSPRLFGMTRFLLQVVTARAQCEGKETESGAVWPPFADERRQILPVCQQPLPDGPAFGRVAYWYHIDLVK